MMIIRPANENDLDSLMYLAKHAGAGFTSLPEDETLIENKLIAAQEAVRNEIESPGEESYLFVMEDTQSGKVVGTCGVLAVVGLSTPWYDYRIGTQVHTSRELGIYNKYSTLNLSNDHTGCAEICTLFLDKDYRHSKNGSLLSKSRFLFLAEFPERFPERVIAEMRGISDENGKSPLWESLGRRFFSMEFTEADRLTGVGRKEFIAELMPRHSLYVNLLPPEAQEVLGKVHQNTIPARKLLENEGFRYEGYVDMFDGGPTLEIRIQDIRAVRESRLFKVEFGDVPDNGIPFLISNTSLDGFRCVLSQIQVKDNTNAKISSETAEALELKQGELMRIVPLSSSHRF